MSRRGTPAVPTAWWPSDRLLAALRRAGWGPLHGRAHGGVRAVLAGLVESLPYKSASGQVTAWQLAQRAGISERWARHCLGLLEAGGFITWERGGVVQGTPIPSTITIHKDMLVGLIHAARETMTAAAQEVAEATRRRVRGMTLWYRTRKRKRSRRTGAAWAGTRTGTRRGQGGRRTPHGPSGTPSRPDPTSWSNPSAPLPSDSDGTGRGEPLGSSAAPDAPLPPSQLPAFCPQDTLPEAIRMRHWPQMRTCKTCGVDLTQGASS